MNIKNAIKQHPALTISILGVLVVALIGYAYRAPIKAQLDAWKLLPRNEQFTELYFNDPASLPSEVTKGTKIDFSFTIHNLEGTDKDYTYSVYFTDAAGAVTSIDKNTHYIANDGNEIIQETYTYSGTAGRITVELPELNQSLHFSVIPAK